MGRRVYYSCSCKGNKQIIRACRNQVGVIGGGACVHELWADPWTRFPDFEKFSKKFPARKFKKDF